MDFKEIAGIMSERKGAVATAALGVAALGGLAWALSTGPLTPVVDGAGSAGSMGSHSPVAVGSAEPGADAPAEPEEDLASSEEAGPAAGDPTGTDPQSPAAGSGEGAGDPGKQQASSQAASKPSHGESRPSTPNPSPKPSAPKPSPKPDAPKPPTPKPSHTHSWNAVYRTEPVYGQQWVSKWEDVYKGRQVCWECSACGCKFMSDSAIDSHIWDTYGDAQHPNGASAIDQSYDIWEKEDHGSYQTVQTGTKQVLDHYECSCGATK